MNRPEKITIARAAELLGKSTLFVRECMKRGTLPIGTAAQMPGSTRWTFIISPRELADYIGCSVAELYGEAPEPERPAANGGAMSEEQIRAACRAFERFLRSGAGETA